MTCQCGYADECDGETAVFYPLQDGGMCSVTNCRKSNDTLNDYEKLDYLKDYGYENSTRGWSGDSDNT